MLLKYRPAVDNLTPGVARALTVRFALPGSEPLYDELHAAGLGQADIVLELLRLDLIPEVESLIGKPIAHLPLRPIKPYPPLPRRAPGPDDRRIKSVVRNPRLPTTDSFQRFKNFRPGFTLGYAVKRGTTRKDIREALKNNWIELEAVS